jgi:hypothetical protein
VVREGNKKLRIFFATVFIVKIYKIC